MRLYSSLLFVLTLTIGVIEVLGIPEVFLIPRDVFGGFVLIVISAVFLRGLTSGEIEPYFCFGSLLLAVFGILYILVLIANCIDALIVGEEITPLNDLRVEILMLPLSFPGVILMNKRRKELAP